MLTLPEIVQRPERAYAYIPFEVRMNQMQKPAQEGFPVLFGYLQGAGIAPVGPAFYNYRRIDMASTLDVEAGVAVERSAAGSDGVRFGTLPAGRYVTLDWIGHPDQLMTVTAMLIGWAKETGNGFDVEEKSDGDHFACRLEVYEDGPDTEPDMNKWKTTLEFKLRD